MTADQQGIDGAQAESALVEFKFEQHAFRALSSDSGDIRFVANDACTMLELTNPRKAIANLDDDEKGVTTIQTNGGPQEVNVITESGLYNLIFLSRKPKAKAIRRWVTHEVLPALRKTGRYEVGQEAEQKIPDDEGAQIGNAKPSQEDCVQIPKNNVGRFVVTINPEGWHHVYKSDFEHVLNEADQINILALCYSLKIIEAFLQRLQQEFSLGVDPKGGQSLRGLEEAVFSAARHANHFMEVYASPRSAQP